MPLMCTQLAQLGAMKHCLSCTRGHNCVADVFAVASMSGGIEANETLGAAWNTEYVAAAGMEETAADGGPAKVW